MRPKYTTNICCQDALVECDYTTAVILLIINALFCPGLGTAMSSMASKDKTKGINTSAILVGIIQFLLTYLLIGYIWAVYHGIVLVRISSSRYRR